MAKYELRHFGWLLAVFLLAAGCTSAPEQENYVARIGDSYLTAQDLDEALESLPPGQNMDDARDQIVERWVHNTLLYQEALRRDLTSDPEVQRRIEENEQSLLVSSMLSRLEDEVPAPTRDEIQSYFERNHERLRLREPYLRVRYLQAGSEAAAGQAREQLRNDHSTAIADSTWPLIAGEYSTSYELSTHFTDNYFPERSIQQQLPLFADRLPRMNEGEISPIVENDGTFYFIQLIDRAPAGSLPQLAWVEHEVRRLLEMQSRKQSLARKVQHLRNEATAREDLHIPSEHSQPEHN